MSVRRSAYNFSFTMTNRASTQSLRRAPFERLRARGTSLTPEVNKKGAVLWDDKGRLSSTDSKRSQRPSDVLGRRYEQKCRGATYLLESFLCMARDSVETTKHDKVFRNVWFFFLVAWNRTGSTVARHENHVQRPENHIARDFQVH
jgi:hypothetical protein